MGNSQGFLRSRGILFGKLFVVVIETDCFQRSGMFSYFDMRAW